MSHAKTQRRKGGERFFRLAVSRRRTRIRFPCLTPRRKGNRQGRDEPVSRKGAKGQREKVGWDRRVCAAVPSSTTYKTYDSPSTIYCVRRVQTKDRGTYQGSHVSRKGAKARRGGTVFRLAVSRRRTRIRFPCLTQRRRRKCEPVRGSCGRCRGAERGCGRIECPANPSWWVSRSLG
jgi:hypothetical protein